MADDLEPGTVSWGDLYTETEGLLGRLPFEIASNEARWIVEEAAGGRLEDVADQPATQRGVAHLDTMVARRSTGEPLQYVLGHWPFRTLDLFVDARVLIPRPETEVVAGVAIDELARRGAGARAVDLGTGSGAIALSIAAECRGVEVWAVERSSHALEVARANLAGLGRRASSVSLREGFWFDAVPGELRGRVDVVVSNPPYVTADDPLPSGVEQWEPVESLRAGADGLDDLRIIIGGSPEWLTGDGILVCEIDPRQADAVVELADDHGFDRTDVVPDLSGRPRVLVARRA